MDYFFTDAKVYKKGVSLPNYSIIRELSP